MRGDGDAAAVRLGRLGEVPHGEKRVARALRGRLRRPQQIDKGTGSSRRAAVGQHQTQPKQHRGAAHAWQDDARSRRIG